jgi:hypothetical protein
MQVTMFRKLQPFDESNFWKNTEKFIFISTRPATHDQITLILSMFHGFSVLNAITIVPHIYFFRVFSYNPFLSGDEIFYEISNQQKDTSEVFNDKLVNLHGYRYKAVSSYEGGYMSEKNKIFMGLMCRLQNASSTLDTKRLEHDANRMKTYLHLMIMKKVDLSLNTGIFTTFNNEPLPSVITYDETTFCAMVPLPPRTPFIELILKPFDQWTWIAAFVTVTACAGVWKLIRYLQPNTGNSTWHFLFGIFANFVGQAIEFRRTHKRQVLLIQMSVMMGFILGNVYQSMLTTFMTESRDGRRLNTLKELMQSDYNFHMDPILFDAFEKSNDLSEIIRNVTKMTSMNITFNFSESSANNVVYMFRCDMVELYFNHLNLTESPVNYYYILPEKFFKSMAHFELSDDSPYQSIFQHYSDLVFESGIKQHWEDFMYKLEDNRAEIERRYYSNEEYLLKIHDLKGLFIIWLICLVACAVVFLAEVLTHKCMKHFGKVEKLCCGGSKNEGKVKKRRNQVHFVEIEPFEIFESSV